MRLGTPSRTARTAAAALAALVVPLGAVALLIGLSPPMPACAADVPHAALIVVTGSQTIRYCVALDGQSVDGLHLVALAHAQHGLQYRLGFGGQAVCQLAGVGASGDTCFGAYPNFWGLWQGDGHGGWSWSSSGGASVSIRDGDLEAWTWGAGDSGATHPSPPAATFVSVCGAASTPSSVPPASTRGPSPTPAQNGAGAGGTTTGGGAGTSATTPRTSNTAAAVASDERPSVVVAAAADPGGGTGGPPPGAWLAIAATIVLGVIGWVRVRMRRRDETSPLGGAARSDGPPPADGDDV